MRRLLLLLAPAALAFLAACPSTRPEAPPDAATGAAAGELNDCHFHLTNYIQEGIDLRKFLTVMGDKVGRSALFGIPLQQSWSHRVSGDNAPTYYLQADTPLYYYSFTDAYIAMAYRSLTPDEQKRFDPMITGFNPADMYAADHIKRVLTTFPGVFTGIGEFTIHKEFVSSKVSGETASLKDPALDRILDFCAETGLLVLLHNDIDVPFPKPGAKPAYLEQMRDLLLRHPKTPIIWAHMGVGRIIRPIANHMDEIEDILKDPRYAHVNFDISWDEVAKYVTASPNAVDKVAAVLNRYPDRFLFGSDEVAPPSQESYLKVDRQYAPLWEKLTPEAAAKVRAGNYARLFDAAARKVRAWERDHGSQK